MPGPVPQPTKLKMLRGNPGKRPLPRGEPHPSPCVPTRPAWLLPEAKREWNRIVPELHRLGLLTVIDRAELAAYCQCWAMYVEAVLDIREHGTTFETQTGYQGPRPSVAIMVKMLDKVLAFAARFGLSPADRSRIDLPMLEEEDEFTTFLKKQRGDE